MLTNITPNKLRNDGQMNVFFTIKHLLQNVASIAVGGESNNLTPWTKSSVTGNVKDKTDLMQVMILRFSLGGAAALRQCWTAQLPNLRSINYMSNQWANKNLWAIISKPLIQIALTILAHSFTSATLSFCWRKIEACWSEDLMIRVTKDW